MNETNPAPHGTRKFPKKARISSRTEITRMYHEGTVWKNTELTIISSPGKGSDGRMAVLVSRRLGDAVARNRYKRIVREVFRRNAHVMPPGIDMLIMPRGTRTFIFTNVEQGLLTWAAHLHKSEQT